MRTSRRRSPALIFRSPSNTAAQVVAVGESCTVPPGVMAPCFRVARQACPSSKPIRRSRCFSVDGHHGEIPADGMGDVHPGKVWGLDPAAFRAGRRQHRARWVSSSQTMPRATLRWSKISISSSALAHGSGANGTVAGLTYSTITNAKVVQMASTKTHYRDVTLAYLRELRNVPDAAALRNAAYYMHPSFEQLLGAFNTSGNKPWNPQAQIAATAPTRSKWDGRWMASKSAGST